MTAKSNYKFNPLSRAGSLLASARSSMLRQSALALVSGVLLSAGACTVAGDTDPNSKEFSLAEYCEVAPEDDDCSFCEDNAQSEFCIDANQPGFCATYPDETICGGVDLTNEDAPTVGKKKLVLNYALIAILDVLKLQETTNHVGSFIKLQTIIKNIEADKSAPPPKGVKPLAPNDPLNSGRMTRIRNILRIENVDKHVKNLRKILNVFKEIEANKGKKQQDEAAPPPPKNEGPPPKKPKNEGPPPKKPKLVLNDALLQLMQLLQLQNPNNHYDSFVKLQLIVKDIEADKSAPPPEEVEPLAPNDPLNSGRMTRVRNILKIQNVDKHVENLRKILEVFKEIQADKGKQKN